MLYNKKGDFTDLKNIILVIIVGVILLLIMPLIIKGGSRGSEIAACKNWAVINSIKDPAIGTIKISTRNPCTTFHDKIKEEEKAYETLAKGMHDTWKMYGQGKIDFFSDWDWFKKNTYCFVGDEIEIEKDTTINIDKFEEYLSTTYIPKSEITYNEFFTEAKNTNLDFGSDNIELKKGEKVYVMFAVQKKSGSDYGIIISGLPGCVVGAKIGAIIGGTASIGSLTIPAGALGCGIGGIISLGAYVSGHSDYLYPGLILIPSKDTKSLEKDCDGGIHYNPK